MNNTHQQTLEHIKKITIDLKQQQNQQLTAAFDADGTLWSVDVGEEFFDYQLKNNLIRNPLPKDPWKHYFDLKSQDPRAAYLWLAQVLNGHSLSEVREWNRSMVEHLKPLALFEFQKHLIDFFHQQQIKVYVVTASIKWAVEAPAALYGIAPEKVVGVKTKVENNIITDIQDGAVTYREGKVQGLLEQTNNLNPFFAAGNTMGDFELLQCSTHLKLAVHTVSEKHPNYQTECELQTHAKDKNWLSLSEPELLYK